MRTFVRLGVVALLSTVFAGSASAEDEKIAQGVFDKDNYPLEVIYRPLTLVGGQLEIRGDTFRMGLNAPDPIDFAKPIVFAPDIYYGINGQFTVGVHHKNRFGIFLPAGFCVSGQEGGCYKSYNAIGGEAQFALTRGGNVGIMAHGGLSSPAFALPTADGDEFLLGLDAGIMMRFRGGKIAVVLDPGVYIGAIGRDFVKDYVFVPIDIQYQLNVQTNVYLSSGFNGPFKNLGDFYNIPVGLGATLAANNRIDFGGEIEVENAAGKDKDLDGDGDAEYGKFDVITFIARMAIRI